MDNKGGSEGFVGTTIGEGFSRSCWPDKFALGKAFDKLARLTPSESKHLRSCDVGLRVIRSSSDVFILGGAPSVSSFFMDFKTDSIFPCSALMSKLSSPSIASKNESKPFFEPRKEILSLSKSKVASADSSCNWKEDCRSTEQRFELAEGGGLGLNLDRSKEGTGRISCMEFEGGETTTGSEVSVRRVPVGVARFKVQTELLSDSEEESGRSS